MVERNLRLQKEREIQSVQNDFHGKLDPQWLWTQIIKAARAGQGWFVISLAGVTSAILCRFALCSNYRRRLHWYQCCCYINCHCLAFRYQDGLLS